MQLRIPAHGRQGNHSEVISGCPPIVQADSLILRWIVGISQFGHSLRRHLVQVEMPLNESMGEGVIVVGLYAAELDHERSPAHRPKKKHIMPANKVVSVIRCHHGIGEVGISSDISRWVPSSPRRTDSVLAIIPGWMEANPAHQPRGWQVYSGFMLACRHTPGAVGKRSYACRDRQDHRGRGQRKADLAGPPVNQQPNPRAGKKSRIDKDNARCTRRKIHSGQQLEWQHQGHHRRRSEIQVISSVVVLASCSPTPGGRFCGSYGSSSFNSSSGTLMFM